MKRFLALAAAATLAACVSVQSTASLANIPATSTALACVSTQARALGYTVHGSGAGLHAERSGTHDRLSIVQGASGYQVRVEGEFAPKTEAGAETRRRLALDAANIETHCAVTATTR